jgi:hypothetical protein
MLSSSYAWNLTPVMRSLVERIMPRMVRSVAAR